MKKHVAAGFLLLMLVSCSSAPPASSTEVPVTKEPTSAMSYPHTEPSARSSGGNEWRSIPILPGATSAQEAGNTYQFTANAHPGEVQEFYNEKLAALGWSRPFEGSFGAEGGTLTFRKEESSLAIHVTSGEGSVTVLLVLTLA